MFGAKCPFLYNLNLSAQSVYILISWFVQDIEDTVAEALRGEVRELPGLDFLNENYPIKTKELGVIIRH